MTILSNAERLEQIKNKPHLFTSHDEQCADKNWLIEQVEHLKTVERHLKEFKQFEYEERMLNQKYEQALKEIAEGAGDYYQDDQAQIAIQALEETK